MESTTITVTVYRRSFLPRMVKAEKILLDQMSTGWIKDGRFVPGETGEEAVLAYHKDHIGRGIQIHWKKDDPRPFCLNSIIRKRMPGKQPICVCFIP